MQAEIPHSTVERDLDDEQPEQAGEKEIRCRGEGEEEKGGQEVVYKITGSTNYLDSTNTKSTNTSPSLPTRALTPRSFGASRRLDLLRSHDFFRMQYLSHLGISANNEVVQLNSAYLVTGACDKASGRSAEVGSRENLEWNSSDKESGNTTLLPPVPEGVKPKQQQQGTALPASPTDADGTASRKIPFWQRSFVTNVGSGAGGTVSLIDRDESTTEQAEGSAGLGVARRGGFGGGVGGSSKPEKEKEGSDVTLGESRARTGAPAPAADEVEHVGSSSRTKKRLSVDVVVKRQEGQTPHTAGGNAVANDISLEKSLGLSMPLSGASTPRSGASISKLRPTSPFVRAVNPPRRDIRKDYLTNLGLQRAVVAGPGGTRSPPPILRQSSLYGGSVEHPVKEHLKDPNTRDVKFEALLRVVGNLLGGGKKENQPRPCQACEREKTHRDSPPEHASSLGVGGEDRGEKGSGTGDRKGEAKNGLGIAEVTASVTCRHKHVEFSPMVSAVYIPVHSEYSDRVRRSYWNTAGEIREMVYRNMLEFDAEDYDWKNVAEEEDMYYSTETGEFIHPIFFEAERDAREVRVAATNQEDDLEFISEGRPLPVMPRP